MKKKKKKKGPPVFGVSQCLYKELSYVILINFSSCSQLGFPNLNMVYGKKFNIKHNFQ